MDFGEELFPDLTVSKSVVALCSAVAIGRLGGGSVYIGIGLFNVVIMTNRINRVAIKKILVHLKPEIKLNK